MFNLLLKTWKTCLSYSFHINITNQKLRILLFDAFDVDGVVDLDFLEVELVEDFSDFGAVVEVEAEVTFYFA